MVAVFGEDTDHGSKSVMLSFYTRDVFFDDDDIYLMNHNNISQAPKWRINFTKLYRNEFMRQNKLFSVFKIFEKYLTLW